MPAPKFSVLLPTRDRLDFAKGAIATVRGQTYRNWELVVADNCSAEDVAGYIASVSDDRIVYTRSGTPIPVTENWTRALNASSGAFIIMLGDDDGLVPGYFERLLVTISALDEPDFVYHGAYHFAFPGAMPGLPQGALTDVTRFQSILRNRRGHSLLEKEEAHAVARAALDMRAHYAFNMQHFLFTRSFVDRMAKFGAFFQGPFPDFYAANMSMLMADRIGLLAEPTVIIGISPKSYGFYHFNKREKGGIAFLNTPAYVDQTPEALRKQLLPGTNMNSSWLLSVALVADHLGRTDLQLNVARYRRLQIIDNLKRAALGQSPDATLGQLWPRLNWSERLFSLAMKAILLPASLPVGRIRHLWVLCIEVLTGQYLRRPKDRPPPVVGRYQTMMDVFEGLQINARSTTTNGESV
jgi:glycosyltransferase involved in cell wall biosynthesis